MQAQRERARAASQFAAAGTTKIAIDESTEFTGYDYLKADAEVVGLFSDGEKVDVLSTEEVGVVVLDCSPFYAESGGQVGDRGVLYSKPIRFEVSDTQKQGDTILHFGVVTEGELRLGDKLKAEVDESLRTDTVRNHSGTHLLHAALRAVLGDHVVQKGSLVAPDRLRFDFSHFEPLTPEELADIELAVNQWILANGEAQATEMPLDKALAAGVLALFGEKYDDVVRVMQIGDASRELCGGTHVARSGDIGLFKIVAETGVAAGVRRIEALTGNGALAWLSSQDEKLARVAGLLKSDRDGVEAKLSQLLGRNRELEKELESLKGKLASRQGGELADQAVDVDGFKVLAAKVEGVDAKALRDTVDRLKDKLGSAVIVLASVDQQKVSLVAGVTKDGTDRVQAGNLVNFVAEQVGGRGGGRPDMAQAGGNDPSRIEQALESVAGWVTDQLAS